MSANAVYSRDNKSAYVQIPELSDAYLMVNVDSLKDKVGSELLHRALTLILSLILLRTLMLILILTHLKRIWRNTRRL